MTSTKVPSAVIVHPLVLLSAVDHYNRVAKDSKKRVVGCLLGQVWQGKIDAINSFALPFEEDEKDPSVWYLDHNFMESMYAMFRKVASSEKIVGWYSTGPKIRASDILINEVFAKYCPNPIYVIIDVAPKSEAIPNEAYCSVYEVKNDGTASESTFVHVPSMVGALEAEEIGVEHLLRDVKDTTISSLAHNITAKLHSLSGLHQRLLEMQTYLENVCTGKMPVNNEIIYSIQEIFNLLPSTQMLQMSKSFAVETNDMLLVVYLSSLVRSVIALHDLISNKKGSLASDAAKPEQKQLQSQPAQEAKDAKDAKPATDRK
jgi:26S proteasome regulatory subunit N8